MQKGARHIILGSVLLLLVAASASAQDYTTKVQFRDDSTRNTKIGIFRRQGNIYCSLTDLAEIFTLGTFENHGMGKFEIKRPPYRIIVSAGSPFIVVSDSSGNKSIFQLPYTIVHAAGSYFVPLTSFLTYFDLTFNTTATFDERENVLRIGPPVAANAFDISTLELTPKANGMLIRIPSSKPLPDLESWLRQDGWLYLTISDARADTATINSLPPSGLVRKIVAIQSPTSVQLTFKLVGKVATSEIIRSNSSNDVYLSIRTPGPDEKALLEKEKREVRASLESDRKRWRLDVIVLDPGHGGRDWGASGVSGVREKDVALGIALKLGNNITRNLKGVKVVYTRKDDRFVELDRRGQIANEEGGKLFVSIHCNSLAHKPSSMRGFEVYLLRPGRTEEAITIAERENAVIKLEEGYEERYKELTEENFILVAMAQSAYVKSSELFADLTQQEIKKRTKIPDRGVKQAGFYVLVGAAMPNVLVETAYLSNREDEKFLRSESGQQKIADALFRAIKNYKDEYEKVLMEGKDIGSR